jgi:hypothetical protein
MPLKLPLTEKDISRQIGQGIKSPILVSDLDHLGIDKSEFLSFYGPLFAELSWDPYDARRLRVEYLAEVFPADVEELLNRLPDYYIGKKDSRSFRKWTSQLNIQQRKAYEAIHPWRRRAVAKFVLSQTKRSITIKRKPVPQFAQSVDQLDVRSLPRVFDEAPTRHVEVDLFYDLLRKVFEMVQEARAQIDQRVKKISITAHFMSVQATSAQPGDNSPEGAHEDGADYIISALVINRLNVNGGQTQIIERSPAGKKSIIYRRILLPGEFVFQADTRDEITYGTDLWHHVTPFHLADPEAGEGWRDIIGFDIMVLE